MSSDFGYINARVKGMGAKLLDSDFYLQALGDSDFGAFRGTLLQTPYSQDLEEAQGRLAGLAAVDRAVAQNFRRTARSILGFSDGRPHRLIALMLMRYDLMNLKALARAKHADRPAQDTAAALLPAGELRPAVLELLAGAPDLPAMAQALALTKHPLSRAFSRAVRRYASEGDLYALELALDRAYFETLLAGFEEEDAPKELRRHAEREIDAANLRTALKVRGRGPSDDDLFVGGGREIDRGTFAAIRADDSPAALKALARTSFAEVAESDSLSEADAIIRRELDQSARRLARRDPLGPGVVLDFLRRKETEAAQLRLLARGKYYDVPRTQLEKELGRA